MEKKEHFFVCFRVPKNGRIRPKKKSTVSWSRNCENWFRQAPMSRWRWVVVVECWVNSSFFLLLYSIGWKSSKGSSKSLLAIWNPRRWSTGKRFSRCPTIQLSVTRMWANFCFDNNKNNKKHVLCLVGNRDKWRHCRFAEAVGGCEVERWLGHVDGLQRAKVGDFRSKRSHFSRFDASTNSSKLFCVFEELYLYCSCVCYSIWTKPTMWVCRWF